LSPASIFPRPRAFSGEADAGSPSENAMKQTNRVRGLIAAILFAFACSALPGHPAVAEKSHAAKAHKTKTTKHARPSAPAPAPEPEPLPAPYEAQILRLAEILGGLTYLGDLCGLAQEPDWRAQMADLMEAEGKTPRAKERLAGAYNRSFRDYELSYRVCTPNAQAIITRFLEEGGRIAHEVANRYGSS
jgi:uncharacterized protein (TIGR02301 family)